VWSGSKLVTTLEIERTAEDIYIESGFVPEKFAVLTAM